MARRPRRPAAADPFDATDRALLKMLQTQNLTLRAILCTLARYGVAFRQREPERAERWLELLGVHPFFKGGQFLFDLLEWEDFMLDGEPPPLLDASTLGPIVDHIAKSFGLDIKTSAAALTAITPAEEPPPLRASYYLYHDVVSGLLWVIRRLKRQTDRRRG
jgi:hypothetical protein